MGCIPLPSKKKTFPHSSQLRNNHVEYFWIVLGALLILTAVIGCVLPVLPGSPLAYLALLLLLIVQPHLFTVKFLLIMAALHVLVLVFDFLLPIIGAKRFGAGKEGIIGSTIGMLVGLIFFPPFGLFLGLLAGAFLGELWAGKKVDKAFKAGFASFAFGMLALVLKLVIVFASGWYFFQGVTEILNAGTLPATVFLKTEYLQYLLG